VKSQIIQGCQSTKLRRKALHEDLNLETLLSSARALEISEKQATEIEHADTDFPQFLHVVLFLGFDSVCVSNYRGLFRRLLKFCILMAFADLKSVSACSISVACFSEISRALAEDNSVSRFKSSCKAFLLSLVDWQP
jgi:hypothetical protein